MSDINIILKYKFCYVFDEEQLKSEIVRRSLMVAESYQEYYNAIYKKILLDSDFIIILQKTLKDELTSDNTYIYNLVECAKEYYKCDEFNVFLKCLDLFKQEITEEESIIINSISDGINLLEIIDNKLFLPEKWLSPTVYQKIGEFLKTFDFERKKIGKRIAYINNGEFTCQQVLDIGKKLNGISLSEKFDFFPTPKNIVSKVIELAEIKDNITILEPSAGKGDLIKNIKNCKITVVELNPILCEILKTQNYHNVFNQEFENFMSDEKFDRIVMNPPFSNRLDAKHIFKAFNNHLKDDGILVAIHSTSIINATDKHSKKFQDLCNHFLIERIELNSGDFKDSGKGTNIKTIISKFRKKQTVEFKVELKNEQLNLF